MPVTGKRTTLAQVTIFASGSTAALVSGAFATSAGIDFSQNNTLTQGFFRGKFYLSATAGAAPTANTGWAIYSLASPDSGMTFETAPTSGPALTAVIATIPAATTDNAAFVRASPSVDGPAGTAKVILFNNGTGQQLNAGWSLTWVPTSDQGV